MKGSDREKDRAQKGTEEMAAEVRTHGIALGKEVLLQL